MLEASHILQPSLVSGDNMPNILQQLNNDLASVANGASHSLVQVHNGRGGAGSGTIWHPQGLIVTNAHVVHGGRIWVRLADKRDLPARLLATDPNHDLAALAVDAAGLPTIAAGESRTLKPGQLVMAVGHPWGVIGALTFGVVIGLETYGHGYPMQPSGREWVVVDIHLRPGNSGGPLLDAQGRLVGINTMVNGPDVGLAVPVHVAKRFLREALGSQSTAA
jgi:serine protease Do